MQIITDPCSQFTFGIFPSLLHVLLAFVNFSPIYFCVITPTHKSNSFLMSFMHISSQLPQCKMVWKFPIYAVGIKDERGLKEQLDYFQVMSDVLRKHEGPCPPNLIWVNLSNIHLHFLRQNKSPTIFHQYSEAGRCQDPMTKVITRELQW